MPITSPRQTCSRTHKRSGVPELALLGAPSHNSGVSKGRRCCGSLLRRDRLGPGARRLTEASQSQPLRAVCSPGWLRNLHGNPQTPPGKRPVPFGGSSLTLRYESSFEMSIRFCGGCDHCRRRAGPDRPGGIRRLTRRSRRPGHGLVLADVRSCSDAIACWAELDRARQPADRGRQALRRPRRDH